jgi:hypothetical protein
MAALVRIYEHVAARKAILSINAANDKPPTAVPEGTRCRNCDQEGHSDKTCTKPLTLSSRIGACPVTRRIAQRLQALIYATSQGPISTIMEKKDHRKAILTLQKVRILSSAERYRGGAC